jgi:hypothetical protein
MLLKISLKAHRADAMFVNLSVRIHTMHGRFSLELFKDCAFLHRPCASSFSNVGFTCKCEIDGIVRAVFSVHRIQVYN